MESKTPENCNHCQQFKLRGTKTLNSLHQPKAIERAWMGDCLKHSAQGPKDREGGMVVIDEKSKEAFVCFEGKP